MAQARHWDLEGNLVGQGSPFGMADLSVGRYFAYIWWFITRDAETADVEKFRARLWMPPPSEKGKRIPAQSPWSAESEGKAFASFKAQTSS